MALAEPGLASYRRHLALLLLAVVPFGFASKLYAGPFSMWVRASLGGVLYEVFWCLLLALLWPRLEPLRIAVLVFAATALLEVLQLWHAPFLEAIRGTFIGHIVLGSTFDWRDFAYYVVGCFLGYLMLAAIRPRGPLWEESETTRSKEGQLCCGDRTNW